MNIYVGNLSRSSSEETVRNAFAQYGTVTSVKIILDRDTGQPRGFAFVDMPSAEEAQMAIEKMNGVELDGRRLNVNEAQERTGGFGGGGGGGGGGGRRPDRGPRGPRDGGNGGGFRSRY